MTNTFFTGNFKNLSKESLLELLGSSLVEVKEGQLLEDVLIEIKTASSKREAREFIKGNSIAINGEKETSLEKVITKADTLHDEYIVLKRGKKNYYLIKLI